MGLRGSGSAGAEHGRATRGFGRRKGARPGRLGRALLAALVVGAVVVPLSAAGRPRVPAPPPATLPPLSAATLPTIYAANRADAAEAARMATAHGDRRRATADRALASTSRKLLAFDGRGTGRATEVFGDLTRAEHIAVLVPGSDTTLETYGRLRAGALALHHRTGPRTAVIAWLGYDTPRMLSTDALTTGRAEQAAPGLTRFLRQLRGLVGPSARISLLCHSYGTVVCARTAPAAEVRDIVLVGSPGTGVDSAADLHTRARVWAARGARDWIADVPHTRVTAFGTTVGFGTDPVSAAYGARVFDAGDGGHSDYFAPGSVSVANLARIVLGRTPEADHA
ncbi:alpha/beta hydrolase family protein [Streptomyces sp. RY43-2]|uniref:Alpha/beta hydrolase family protein n=1 Tax=Streptomyces macrolidinus TaxID=2952607 RepID=A0ABT0ZE52_9ACTN|nr:alpha/beta hydrolase [Streptomyces macrolidinus]MCN9241837.1 alpha/beta hydrolase family protein [Streptomyces macrolidinus]